MDAEFGGGPLFLALDASRVIGLKNAEIIGINGRLEIGLGIKVFRAVGDVHDAHPHVGNDRFPCCQINFENPDFGGLQRQIQTLFRIDRSGRGRLGCCDVAQKIGGPLFAMGRGPVVLFYRKDFDAVFALELQARPCSALHSGHFRYDCQQVRYIIVTDFKDLVRRIVPTQDLALCVGDHDCQKGVVQNGFILDLLRFQIERLAADNLFDSFLSLGQVL